MSQYDGAGGRVYDRVRLTGCGDDPKANDDAFGPRSGVVGTLRELDVEFEFVNVDLTKGELRRPEFLVVNPAGKLPVLPRP